jgi:hypothetical protein
MSTDDDNVGGAVGFARRAHTRAAQSPEPSPGNEWAARHRDALIQQTAETLRLARAAERTDPSGRPK